MARVGLGIGVASACVLFLIACCPGELRAAPAPAAASQAAGRKDDAATILDGSMTQTARGNGQWQVFFNIGGARIVQFSKEAIWFRRGADAWRYNVKARAIDARTSIFTHPTLNDFGNSALAADGRFAISGQMATYLWTPGKGWSRLPQPQGDVNPQFVSFDSDNRLWASTLFAKKCLWQKDAWGEPQAAPKTSSNLYDTPMRRAHFRKGREIVVCDAASGEVFDLAPIADSARAAVLTAEGKNVAEIPLPPNAAEDVNGKQDAYLRDANGDYWYGPFRYDGKAWQAVAPDGVFWFPGDIRKAVLSGRVQYDDAKKTWTDAWAGIPPEVQAYDPKSRTGWVRRNPREFTGPAAWQQFEFPPAGPPRLLQAVSVDPLRYRPPVPQFKDPDGNWWFGSDRRWDGKAFHAYDDGMAAKKYTSVEEGTPLLFSSGNGHVWMYQVRRTWKRYDPWKDAFVDGEPYDDFSMTFHGQTCAIVGNRDSENMDDGKHSLPGMVYLKTQGQWRSLANPFLGQESLVRAGYYSGFGTFYGVAGRACSGSRMLMSCYTGTFEWDGAKDRWAYLSPYLNELSFFDAKGRRVMLAGDNLGRILMYDGDPFEDSPAAVVRDELASQVDPLLKRMDSDQWKDRDKASAELADLARKNTQPVRAYLALRQKKGDLSAEAKSRVQALLDELQPSAPPGGTLSPEGKKLLWRSKVGNSLFERSCRQLVPEFAGGFAIRTGMPISQARSIFYAAGARYSSEIHNAHHPDPSYQGFLLPDNTMVYLRIDGKTWMTGNIQSIGVGAQGQGYDRNWPWDDKARNGLEKLELKPNLATVVDQ